ncbi:MAG: TOBE domain-containing protein [Clostridiales bacterium]|nr:TOBE domain-containing protein [Clostridiales bacterium]
MQGFHIAGVIKESIYVGVTVKTTVELGNGQLIKITNFPEDEVYEDGEVVYLYWNKAKAVIMHTKEDILYDLIDEAEAIL